MTRCRAISLNQLHRRKAMTPTRSVSEGWPSLTLRVGVMVVFLALVPTARADDKKPAPVPGTVSYYKDVRPILVVHCRGCHQPAKPMGGFVMTSHGDLLKKGDSDEPSIVPGKPDERKIVAQITPDGMGKAAMPKSKDPLGERDREVIKKWIAQG